MFLGSWLLNQRLWVPCEAMCTAGFVSIVTSEVNQKDMHWQPLLLIKKKCLHSSELTLCFTNDLWGERETAVVVYIYSNFGMKVKSKRPSGNLANVFSRKSVQVT